MNKKVILITGASSGMGKETAKACIEKGYTVYTVARRIDQMQDLKTLGGHPIQMDVTKESDIQNVVDTIIQKEGKIDVLWNNAGYGLYGAVEDVLVEEARKQFEVNLFGLAAITRKVVPYMRKANGGTIINTSSMGGKIYTPMGAWYHASKHAVEGFSDCLRLELKEFNIPVIHDLAGVGENLQDHPDIIIRCLDKSKTSLATAPGLFMYRFLKHFYDKNDHFIFTPTV